MLLAPVRWICLEGEASWVFSTPMTYSAGRIVGAQSGVTLFHPSLCLIQQQQDPELNSGWTCTTIPMFPLGQLCSTIWNWVLQPCQWDTQGSMTSTLISTECSEQAPSIRITMHWYQTHSTSVALRCHYLFYQPLPLHIPLHPQFYPMLRYCRSCQPLLFHLPLHPCHPICSLTSTSLLPQLLNI